MYDYSKLRGRIVEKYGTLKNFSAAIGLTPTTLGKKVTNKAGWSQDEVIEASKLLDIKDTEYATYFFTKKVEIS